MRSTRERDRPDSSASSHGQSKSAAGAVHGSVHETQRKRVMGELSLATADERRLFVEVLQPFCVRGRQIPALLEPREHVQVDPGVRGGEPVLAGARSPYNEVAALLRDGVAAEDIGEFFPQVSPAAARDAYDFASYVTATCSRRSELRETAS